MLQIIILAAVVGLGAPKYHPFSQEKGLTTPDKQYLLDRHNTFRSTVALGKSYHKVAAGNMNRLLWNDPLAVRAQLHADDCTGPPHDKEANRLVGTTFKTAGQNMMDCTRTGNCADEAMDAFFEEGKAYAFDANTCDAASTAGKTCGHYLQVTWATTAYVGCGYNKCSNSGKYARLVCNYGEAGVYVGKKPYAKGSGCSQCQSGREYCLEGLCISATDRALVTDSSLKKKIKCPVTEEACKGNGGTYSGDCQCKCPAGKSGPNCGESCTDKYGSKCGGMKQYCGSSSFGLWMSQNCIRTCGLCSSTATSHTANTSIKLFLETNIKLPGTGKKDCRVGKGADYKGKRDYSYTGKKCIAWASSKYKSSVASGSENYCRNPNGGSSYPWCAIAGAPYWQYCNIPEC